MTIEELNSIKFHFVCSLALENEHTITYESEDGRLGFCDHTPKREYGDFGKSRRHWRIDGKIYKTKQKFLEAIADFNPNVLPISHQPYQNTAARIRQEQETKPKAAIVDIKAAKDKEQ